MPETVTDSSLEETALNRFEELGASINPSFIEACHHVGPSSRKKVIIKMYRWKDADKVLYVKKLDSTEVDNSFYIRDISVIDPGPISIYTLYKY